MTSIESKMTLKMEALNENPKNEPSDYAVEISKGSSWAQVADRLRDLCTIEFAVTQNFKVLLHHTDSHLRLMSDSGIAPCDVVAIGNLSLGVGIYEFNARSACVRFKANNAQRACELAERAIDAYLKPLAERVRSA